MGSPRVLEHAFTTMWSLAVLDQNQAAIGSSQDGIHLVVNSMMANVTDMKVQKQACGCICTLASNTQNQILLRDTGGVDAIVFAMWTHFASEQLQTEACRALAGLAVDVTTNEVMIAGDSEISAIISAMRHFPNSAKLQQHGCVALRNFMLSAENIDMARNCADDLTNLVLSASSQFPEECADSVEQIIASL